MNLKFVHTVTDLTNEQTCLAKKFRCSQCGKGNLVEFNIKHQGCTKTPKGRYRLHYEEKDADGNYKKVLMRGYCPNDCGKSGLYNSNHRCSETNATQVFNLLSPPDGFVSKGGSILFEKLNAEEKQVAVFETIAGICQDLCTTAGELSLEDVNEEAGWLLRRPRGGSGRDVHYSKKSLPKSATQIVNCPRTTPALEGSDKKFNTSFKLGQYQYRSIGVVNPAR